MQGYRFEIKNSLTDNELVEYFQFLKNHLIWLYGENAINNESFLSWKSNREGYNKNKFFIKMFKDATLLGYAEMLIRKDNTLYFCDIIIKEEMRRTRLVLEFVKFVLTVKEFDPYEELYLHINKNNNNSFNTWSHFGLEKLEDGKNSNLYKIRKHQIINYINKLNKKSER